MKALKGIGKNKMPDRAASFRKRCTALFELFKARIIEISAELSSLAQAITDAEKREKPREEDIIDHQDKMPGNLQDETSIEIEGYPIAERQKVSPGISVREIIEKVKAIGDRLL